MRGKKSQLKKINMNKKASINSNEIKKSFGNILKTYILKKSGKSRKTEKALDNLSY